MTVSVDELTVEVPAREVVWVEMGTGERTIKLEDDSQHVFDFQKDAYFLNPSKTSYLLNEHFYGDLAAQLSYMSTHPDQKVDFLGLELEGRYEIIDELISEVTWDVGARESMPESVQGDADESYVVLKKLMDPKEFVEEMMQQFQAAEEEEANDAG